MHDALSTLLVDRRLHRDLKVRAALDGVPLRKLVEDALRRDLASRDARMPKDAGS